ncbi:fibronectin type III domain-containing protein [Alkalitalea saponilacus]|uniref:Por secretion system C-terminal sorting domain-containing protein n=1 Tax=Alkalitalea saponilacus TaxID=889453 RepID=A0A1T5D4D3_9BACT|nr:fibronectin type III domain-containing protein [Alkalitalea saponilacus]ASB50573.1 hypothetical protein CDL62_16190 [Alkalitalea saponilacus]SKB66562.1 Por secretion system C-terminal sorting domain-containing protein [Alkalitalea saponilacus]
MKNKTTKPLFYAFLFMFFTTNSFAGKSLDTPVISLDAETLGVNEFRISWDAVEGATYYKIWVSDYKEDSQTSYLPLYNGKIITSNNAWVINLNHEKTYECFIMAYNDNDKSANSNYVQVTTKEPNVDPPVLEEATNITGTSFDVSWSSIAGKNVYYQLLVSDDDFLTLVPGFDLEFRLVTNITVSGLKPLTTYKFKVKAKALDNESTFSQTREVTTKLTPPVALAASPVKHDQFTANWTSVVNATGYKLWVVDSNHQPVDGFYPAIVNDTFKTVTGLNPEATYTYSVMSVAGDLSSTQSNIIEVTTINENMPQPPVALEATHASGGWFLINWEEVENADHYKVYISTDNFASHVPDYDGFVVYGDAFPFENLNYLFDDASPATAYQYRLTSVANGYESLFSNTIEASTTPMPEIPAPPLALGAIEVTENGFTARWEEVDNGIFYRIYVSDDNFDTYISGQWGTAWWTLSLEIDGLESGTTYQYKIKACNDSGRSDYSNVIEVTTLATGTSINNITDLNISIYPNPAQNQINISGLDKNSTLEIFSITGAKMMSLDNQSGNVNLNVSNLENGIYIIKINSKKGFVSRKIFIKK